jgi:hypothetical protein
VGGIVSAGEAAGWHRSTVEGGLDADRRTDEAGRVTSTEPAPHTAPGETQPSRWRVGRVLIVIAVIGMVSMWGYVLYLAFGPGRQPSPDELDDPGFAIAAEARCSEALDAVARLPAASESPSATERAAVIDEANAELAAMLDDLDAIVPRGDDGEIVLEWLADWRTYLDDRERFADALRVDPGSRMLVSAKDGQHITEHLDQFAADNRMRSCATPLDV